MKTSFVAVPAPITILVLAPLVSPDEIAVSVYVPDVFRIRLVKLAAPLTAETVVVPVTEAGKAIVTDALEEVTRLP